MNTIGYTCQITAGFRAVELLHNPQPIMCDHLAQHLAGSAFIQALGDYQKLVAAQGPGRSLRVPARNRIVDDSVLEALRQLQQQGRRGAVQVVNIGCGMDTKPWRLQPPLSVHWFDVDQPEVMRLKQQLLQQAGAATPPGCGGSTAQQTRHQQSGAGLTHPSLHLPPQEPLVQQHRPADVQFALLTEQWRALPVDLAVTPLSQCLEAAGFDRCLPTVWIAEALLYYLPLDKACQLLCDMRALSAPGSKLIATCIDEALQQAHLELEQDHYFSTANVTWHFCMDDLLGTNCELWASDGAAQAEASQPNHSVACVHSSCASGHTGGVSSTLEKTGWRTDQQPRTATQLALERYNRETYVALYGGAEYCFTASPI